MRPLTETLGASGPVWIRCTLVAGSEPIHVNMAFAATSVAHNGGSRIWIAKERRAIDVTESPAEIADAMAAARPPARRGTTEPYHPFAVPLARQH